EESGEGERSKQTQALDPGNLPPSTRTPGNRSERGRCGHQREAERRRGQLPRLQQRSRACPAKDRAGMSAIAVALLRFYKRFISPLLPPMCRFEPTCSMYMMQAIEK